MDEVYREIEQRIRAAGYPDKISGFDIYQEISDQIEDKEPGTYLLFSKKEGDMFLEYRVDVMEEAFNLSYLDIHAGELVYHVDFDL